MDAFIKKSKSKAFSNEDISKLCEGAVNIYTYPELADMSNINQLLNYPVKCGAAIILYLSRKDFGHWVAIFKVPKTSDTIEFFDSYGYSPDDELKMINEKFRKISNQVQPHLSRLIYDSAIKNIIYNNVALQKHDKKQSYESAISTCGRWAGLRISLKEIPLEEFQNLFFKQKFDPDWYVTALTLFI